MSQNRHQSYTNEAEGKIKENIKKKKILLYDFFKIKEEQNANNKELLFNNTKAINSMLGRFGYSL